MALLERVTTLVRANLNDLVDRAENPEKMIKQVILDMQNQFMQVKTQVAIAIADLHLLEKKKKENLDKESEWMRKADLAVGKKDDALARAALERALSFKLMATNFDEQIADQKVQVDLLREALSKLEQKIAEAESKSELLIAQHRRSKAVGRAADASSAADSRDKTATFDRMKNKVMREEAINQAKAEVEGSGEIERKFAQMEKDEQIDKLLAEIKARKMLSA
ncbi:MAG TPA: PspA/IM30 family protein [Terriglobales bacterium]|nr:PspA/IM30 family protein [Terriglobales bacterium]